MAYCICDTMVGSSIYFHEICDKLLRNVSRYRYTLWKYSVVKEMQKNSRSFLFFKSDRTITKEEAIHIANNKNAYNHLYAYQKEYKIIYRLYDKCGNINRHNKAIKNPFPMRDEILALSDKQSSAIKTLESLPKKISKLEKKIELIERSLKDKSAGALSLPECSGGEISIP
jgi:hypothetical protein